MVFCCTALHDTLRKSTPYMKWAVWSVHCIGEVSSVVGTVHMESVGRVESNQVLCLLARRCTLPMEYTSTVLPVYRYPLGVLWDMTGLNQTVRGVRRYESSFPGYWWWSTKWFARNSLSDESQRTWHRSRWYKWSNGADTGYEPTWSGWHTTQFKPTKCMGRTTDLLCCKPIHPTIWSYNSNYFL